MRGRKNTAIFVAIYLVVRVLASVAETKYVGGTGWSPLRIGTGLDIVLFVVYGWRWWPMVVLANVLRIELFPEGLHAAPIVNVAIVTIAALLYALATKVASERFKLKFPLQTVHDVGAFAWFLGAAMPIVVSAAVTAVAVLGLRLTAATALPQFARLLAGEITSVIVVVPVLTQLLAWRVPDAIGRTFRRSLQLWIGLLATFAFVVGVYAISVAVHRPVVELSFVPLAWLAIRNGMRGAVLAILVADVTAVALQVAYAIPIMTQIEYDAYLVATALMALLLGAITNERAVLVATLERRAQFDELTDLPNREQLAAWIDDNRDTGLVLLMLDIDEMRLLNEGVGRGAADRVLKQFADRLRSGLPPSHYIARVDADEFAVAIADDRSPHALIAELRQLLETAFDVEGVQLYVAVSIGAVRMARVADVGEVLRRADLALHRAKRVSSRTAIYTPELQGASVPLLVAELHRAVERRELVPFYQPIFFYDRRAMRWRLVGAEALLRWIHPERGVVTPGDFIELLERLSIGDKAGWDVMEQSLRLANDWRARSPDFQVWVNLFARQALDPRCVAKIRELLELTNAPAQALVVEINERIVVSEEHDISALAQQLRELGVTTAIDDFGTGGSSLGRVRDVPAQVLKIDRSFVTRSEVDAKAKAVAAAVVRLASEIGMAVVAEGVENVMQVETMIEVGCEFAQGYALGHPVPAEFFERIVTESAAV